MEKNQKKAKKTINIKDIKLQYIKGSPVDHTTVRSALSLLGGMVLMAIAYLLLCSAMALDNIILSIIFNGSLMLACLLLFYSSGASKGEVTANQGEMLYDREQSGGAISDKERKSCFHPGKGFVSAAIGTLPVLIAAVILAVTAQRQMTTIGALPSWVESFETRADIGNALVMYHEGVAMALEDVLRVIVRMLLMPLVNIFSIYGADAMLTLERVSPVLVLLPGLAYGIGYTQGVNLRKRVHAGIAEGERKRKKKEKRQRKMQQRQHAPKAPEQLN